MSTRLLTCCQPVWRGGVAEPLSTFLVCSEAHYPVINPNMKHQPSLNYVAFTFASLAATGLSPAYPAAGLLRLIVALLVHFWTISRPYFHQPSASES